MFSLNSIIVWILLKNIQNNVLDVKKTINKLTYSNSMLDFAWEPTPEQKDALTFAFEHAKLDNTNPVILPFPVNHEIQLFDSKKCEVEQGN